MATLLMQGAGGEKGEKLREKRGEKDERKG
jgi:hypothetical protein